MLWTSPQQYLEPSPMEDVNPPPPELFGGGRFKQGQPPVQKIQILWTRPKIVANPPNFEKTIALAFLKFFYPQIPYWVHFTFKVQNPIYIFTSIQ